MFSHRGPRALEVDHQAGAFGLGHAVVVEHPLDERRRRAEVGAHHQQLEPEEPGGLHVVEQLAFLQLGADQQLGRDEHVGDADLVALGAGQCEGAPERGDRDALAGGRDQRDRELGRRCRPALEPGRSRSADPSTWRAEQGRLTPLIRTPSSVCVACTHAAEFRVTTHADPAAVPAPNLLNQVFRAPAANRIWTADITAIPTGEGWLYLAILLNLFLAACRRLGDPIR